MEAIGPFRRETAPLSPRPCSQSGSILDAPPIFAEATQCLPAVIDDRGRERGARPRCESQGRRSLVILGPVLAGVV